MVDQIGIRQHMPDDFGVDLNPQIRSQIADFVADKSESISNLRTTFESNFKNSSTVFKNIVQHFMYSAVDDAVGSN